ncbi:MAG: hypothetical protein J0H97_22245 [Alphaproteobacteria bacterium]|nr:hypothetical protein [Alphaproteobacteria bacterium]
MTDTITTRPATEADVVDIADRLSPPDLINLQALLPATPVDALKSMLTRGECEAVYINGRPEALFGCSSYASRPARGFPWFAASREAYNSEARIADLVRLSQKLLDRWQAKYAELLTMNDTRNASYGDWLSLLGFKAVSELPTTSGHMFNLYFKGAL